MARRKKDKPPAYQHYPDKAILGSQHLSGDSFKAYWMTLWWMWLHSKYHCSMPDTDAAWLRSTGCKDLQSMELCRKEIMEPGFELLRKRTVDGVPFVYSNGLKKTAKNQREWSEKSSKGGIASGKSRSKNGLQSNQNATKVEAKSQPKPNSPSPSPTLKEPLLFPSDEENTSSEKHPKKNTEKPLVIPEHLRANKDFMYAWGQWLDYKKAKKQNLQIQSQNALMKKFMVIGASLSIDRIENSITNNYQGLFWKGESLASLKELHSKSGPSDEEMKRMKAEARKREDREFKESQRA